MRSGLYSGGAGIALFLAILAAAAKSRRSPRRPATAALRRANEEWTLSSGSAIATGWSKTATSTSSITMISAWLQQLTVSEVFLAKRSHDLHGSIGPAQDNAFIKTELISFVANVAGRNATVQNTLAAVLLPDMLIVQTDKAQSTAGWLSWALANGWGGRKLTDDVVDAGLSAIFGALLDPSNVSPGLTTDNVGSDSQFLTTFPYVAAANR